MLLTKSSTDETNLGPAASNFTIAVNSRSFNVLFKKLYTDPVLAVMRELTCNAWDSHIASGQEATPVHVVIPTTADPHFVVRDYGTGLDHQQITTLYTTVFASTKQTDDSVTGGFGLGSKAPFAIVDQFSVVAYDGTTKRIYIATLDGGMPKLYMAGSEPCDEPRGLEVRVPAADPGEWSNKYRIWRAFAPFGEKVTLANWSMPELSSKNVEDAFGNKVHLAPPTTTQHSYILVRHVLYQWSPPSRGLTPGSIIFEPSEIAGFVPPSNRETLESDFKFRRTLTSNQVSADNVMKAIILRSEADRVNLTCRLRDAQPPDPRSKQLWAEANAKALHTAGNLYHLYQAMKTAGMLTGVANASQAVATGALQWMHRLANCEKEASLLVDGPDEKLPASALREEGQLAKAAWLKSDNNAYHRIPGEWACGTARTLNPLPVITQAGVNTLRAYGFEPLLYPRPERPAPGTPKAAAASAPKRKHYKRHWMLHHRRWLTHEPSEWMTKTVEELLDEPASTVKLPQETQSDWEDKQGLWVVLPVENCTGSQGVTRDTRLLFPRRADFHNIPYSNIPEFRFVGVSVYEWEKMTPALQQRCWDRYNDTVIKACWEKIRDQLKRASWAPNGHDNPFGASWGDRPLAVLRAAGQAQQKLQEQCPMLSPYPSEGKKKEYITEKTGKTTDELEAEFIKTIKELQ